MPTYWFCPVGFGCAHVLIFPFKLSPFHKFVEDEDEDSSCACSCFLLSIPVPGIVCSKYETESRSLLRVTLWIGKVLFYPNFCCSSLYVKGSNFLSHSTQLGLGEIEWKHVCMYVCTHIHISGGLESKNSAGYYSALCCSLSCPQRFLRVGSGRSQFFIRGLMCIASCTSIVPPHMFPVSTTTRDINLQGRIQSSIVVC
jgi:hypothetical protein